MKYHLGSTSRKRFSNVLTYIILFVAVFITIIPIFWMITASFTLPTTTMGRAVSEEGESQQWRYSWIIPQDFHFKNYLAVFRMTKFLVYFRNSVFVAGSTTIISIVVAVLAGYSLSRFRFRGRAFYSQALLAMYMFAPVLLLIPIFIILRTIGIYDSPFGLIVAYTSFSLPFCTWMLKGFFDSIPTDLEEQAIVDGCTRIGSMRRILLPLSGPGIATTAIFSFILAWNEFMYANVLIQSDTKRTVTVGLPSFAGQHMTEIGVMLAASTMLIFPVLVFFFFLQKYMVRGLTAGAVKG